MTEAMVDQLYSLADGILFSGGSDIDPKYYKQKANEATRSREPERDVMEMRLVEKAIADKKPILAICRGAQLLNIVQGGTLYQDITGLCQDEVHGSGLAESNRTSVMTNTAQVVPGTELYKILLQDKVRISCNHKQAIDKLGRDLRVSAKSAAGIIEVIESINPSHWCIGIQSHPEISEFTDLEQVFDAFAHVVESQEDIKHNKSF